MLGMDIDADISQLDENFSKTISSLKKILITGKDTS
jgi:hypothetical protein